MSALPRTRQTNVLIAFAQFAREKMILSLEAKGIEQAFAGCVEITPQAWCNIKSGRTAISDALATQIECRAGKPAGWLDEEQMDDQISWLNTDDQELALLALAALRRLDPDGKLRLLKRLDELK